MAVIVEAGPPDPLIGLNLNGYRVERLLGEGGMGLVYLARHEFIDRRFAVKALKPEFAEDAVMARSFTREAQVLSSLKHPHIVDIVGFGVLPDGRHYMVMEFLEGHTLEEELERGRIPLHRVLALMDQTLQALEAAHGAGVIHRDLKPSNVFLARASGGLEVVKLLDFGLARQQPVKLEGLTAARGQTVIAGTPDYIAPEQAQGMQAGPACDLYSFGVMLFELLAGRRPFEPGATGDRVTALLRAHLGETPPSLHELGVDVPQLLSDLVAQCLRKVPSERPASAAELRERIAPFRPILTPSGPMPLVASPAMQSRRSTERAPAQSTEDLRAVAIPQSQWRLPALMGAVVALLAVGLVLTAAPRPSNGTTPPATPPMETAPAAATPVAVAPAAAAPTTPVATAESEPPVARAPTRTEPEPSAPPAPSAPTTVALKVKAAPSVYRSECEPDAQWKAASMTHLQELQQLAAGDDKRWSQFEKLEPRLTQAIEDASTGEACEAVEQQIRRLAIQWRK